MQQRTIPETLFAGAESLTNSNGPKIISLI
jgi:hypothetical protein